MTSVKKKYLLLFFLLIIFYFIYYLTSFNSKTHKYKTIINGKTMGTTYSITINDSILSNDDDLLINLKNSIDSVLINVNNYFSTYIDSSEINKVNRSENIELSQTFTYVYKKAIEYSVLSNGMYDFTISPLTKLWGFADHDYHDFPSNADILNTVNNIGYKKIINISNNTNNYNIQKKRDIKIDLNSIAKGYAVDIIYNFLDSFKLELSDYLIEIGGEIRTKNKSDNNWSIGIQHPLESSLISKVLLDNYSMATSGTYNNYFINDGTEYSHIINPKTGYPIKNNILSATVIAPVCIDADALATMLMILDWEEGIRIINNINNTECLLILKNDNNDLTIKYSDNFSNFIVD